MTRRTMQLHNFYAPGRPESALLHRFAERASASGGIDIEIVHDGATGLDDSAALEWMGGHDGLAVIWPVFMRTRNAELDACYIMGSVYDLREHQRALPRLEDFLAAVLDEANIVPIAFWPSPVLTISVFSRERPATSLADLAGLRLRVFSKDLEPTFRRLGVDARFIPQGELYDALDAGVFDATVYPACHTAWSVPLWRVCRHASYLFPEALAPYILACSSEVWAELEQADRAALREAASSVWPDFLRLSVDPTDEMAARRNLVAGGVTWHADMPSDDRWRFARSAEVTWGEMAAAASPRTRTLHKDIVASLAR